MGVSDGRKRGSEGGKEERGREREGGEEERKEEKRKTLDAKPHSLSLISRVHR